MLVAVLVALCFGYSRLIISAVKLQPSGALHRHSDAGRILKCWFGVHACCGKALARALVPSGFVLVVLSGVVELATASARAC